MESSLGSNLPKISRASMPTVETSASCDSDCAMRVSVAWPEGFNEGNRPITPGGKA